MAKLPSLADSDMVDQDDGGATTAVKPQQAMTGLAALRQNLQRPVAAAPVAPAPEQVAAAPAVAVGYVAYQAGKEYPVGSFLELPLDLVVENPRNPRVYYPESELLSLQVSMAASGQMEAAKVTWVPELQKFMLKSGHRRRRCLVQLRKPTIKVELVEAKDPLLEFREARELNTESRAHTYLDDAVRFPEMMAELSLDQKNFSLRIGMSEAEVSKRIKIGKLPREVLDRLADYTGKVSVEACYKLAQILERTDDLDGLQRIINRVVDGRLSLLELRALADQAKTSPSVALPGASEPDQSAAEKDAGNAVSAKRVRRMLPIARTDLLGNAKGSVKAFENRFEVKLEGIAADVRQSLYERFIDICKQEGIVARGEQPT